MDLVLVCHLGKPEIKFQLKHPFGRIIETEGWDVQMVTCLLGSLSMKLFVASSCWPYGSYVGSPMCTLFGGLLVLQLPHLYWTDWTWFLVVPSVASTATTSASSWSPSTLLSHK